jgi:hypothetical protein
MFASISSLDLLHELVHAVVRDDARDGDAFLVATEMDAGLVRDAAMAQGLHITLCSPSLLPGTGALFAFVASSPAADIAPAIQDAAAADRLALVAWPRRSGDDEASAAIARALGLVPLVAARDDDGVHLAHPTTHPDSPLHVAVRPALLGHGRSSAPVEDAPTDAWRGAAQAYLALGLYGAARVAARRAGEAGDSTAQHANRLADIDTALATALATSAAPLLPVLSGGLGHKVIPLLRAEGTARNAATFGRYLDDEVLGNGVEVIARHFLRMAMGDKATLLDLAPDHGHLAVAIADAVGMWRVVIAGGSAHHALTRSLAPLPNSLRPAVHVTSEDAVLAAIKSGAPSVVVHATLATVVDGTLAGAVVALRTRRADFVVVVSGVTAAVIEADATVVATRSLATQLGLSVRGVGIQKGRLVVDELEALPRAQLLLVC